MQVYEYGTHAIVLVSLSPAIGTVLDWVMEWTNDDIEAAMLASAEALGYGQLTSNESKFHAVEWSCDSTIIDIPLCHGNRATVARPSLPHAGDRNTASAGEGSGLVHESLAV